MISFCAETLTYGPTAVIKEVSLSLQKGERVALLGRSGVGKSTLLSAIRERALAAGLSVALVPQESGLVPQLSVLHNMYMGRLDRHSLLRNLVTLARPYTRDRTEITELAMSLGIADKVDHPVNRLSGGQKQRTAIGRALYSGGDLLLADEPVSSLDERQAPEVLDTLLSRFQSAVVVMHDVELARSHFTRLIGLKDGRVLFDHPTSNNDETQIDHLYAA